MSSGTPHPIPAPVLHRFLRQQMTSKLILVSVSGPHAYGYAAPSSPLELRSVHVEPTESLVGLSHPPRAYNWVGEFEGYRIDYSSTELGEALRDLLKGDGSILERILAPQQLLKSEDLRRLQRVSRGVICRRFFTYYRAFAKGVLREKVTERRSLRQALAAYRQGLTGARLLTSGKLVLDLMSLAHDHGFGDLQSVVDLYRRDCEALLEDQSPWVRRVVKLQTLLDCALETSRLPVDPEHPDWVEEYLLDMRRRFFDAATVQQAGPSDD